MNRKSSLTILFSILTLLIIIPTIVHVDAYPEWHHGELNIVDLKPWYYMHLESDPVKMNLTLTNHSNMTHTFWLIERISNLGSPEAVKSLPNSTIYDDITVDSNKTGTLTFSQQVPTGSWYLYIQVTEDSPNGIQVDDKTQYFVVQPFQDLLLTYGTISSGGIGVATVTALFATKRSADKQTGELRKQTNLSELKFQLLNRPWIGTHRNLRLEDSQLVLAYTNYGQLPTTGTRAQFLISDTRLFRIHFHVSAVIQTLELGTLMPMKKEELTIVLTKEQMERALSGGEFYAGVRISYLYSGGFRGEYGVIYHYNRASNSFVIEEEWTDLNKRHPIPESDGNEIDEHAGLMKSVKEKLSPLDRVGTEEIIFLDDNEDRVLIPKVKQRIRIGLTIRNNQDKTQPFVCLVQIQNPEGVTERLNSITGVISPWQSLQPLIPWTPERQGDHIMQFFVWESIEEPKALSPTLTITISAIEKNDSIGKRTMEKLSKFSIKKKLFGRKKDRK